MSKKNQDITILVVEDDKPMANAMELKFKKLGYLVTVARNGQQALDALKEGKYDLMLLDLIMPGVDGFEVLAKVKEQKRNIKVVVTSNLSQEEDIKKAKELGATDFLVKSDVTLAEIVDRIKEILT